MLTIFAVPKAFMGHFALIQENAIASWTKLKSKCEIILVGDEFGTAEISKKYNLRHIETVEKTPQGTPLVSDVFKKVIKVARNPLLTYVNADIILMSDFLDAVKKVSFKEFLMSGQRCFLNIKRPINFQSNWENRLRQMIESKRQHFEDGGIDYFVFPKSLNFKMPPFAIGRGVWDNWLICRAKFLKIPVLDASQVVRVIHQKHDYSHAGGYRSVWQGAENKKNLQLARGKSRHFNLLNSDWILTTHGYKRPQFSFYRFWRNLLVYDELHPQIGFATYPIVVFIEFCIKVFTKIKRLYFKRND